MSAPDAMRCFETLVTRMESAVAIDAWLLGLGDEGALLAELLARKLPGRNNNAALDLNALAQGVLLIVPETSPPLQRVSQNPLPRLRGRVGEGGELTRNAKIDRHSPHPDLPPQAGEGVMFAQHCGEELLRQPLQEEGLGGDGVSAPFSKGVSAKPTGVCRSQEEKGRKSDTTIVLVDAVLWHGETVVQAVSLLRQHGVHAPIELAVLADRGGHLVPVAPTYGGGEIIVAEDTALRLVADGDILRFNEA